MSTNPFVSVAGAAIAFVLGVSAADAALTTESCLAKKGLARGKFQQCQAVANGKILQGKSADPGKCSTKLQEQIAKLDDKANKAGIGCRYHDNGDGTVLDFDTGLQWEMKGSAGGGPVFSNPHDVDNSYVWTALPTFGGMGGTGTLPNGTAFTSFLAILNRNSFAPGLFIGFACFAGHCDWRLPTLSELQGIQLLPCVGGPCIDPVFGPSGAGAYLSSTQSSADSTLAWFVDFGDGSATALEKDGTSAFARAVRGGS